MLPQEIIRKKRDNNTLTPDEIREFVNNITAKKVGEGQIAAFCMATLLNGMSIEERVALTLSMANSGEIINWSEESLDGPVLDKHSTGGVGDKVSLMLAPIIAACGGFVPMISGRGLGHTGGTLDKMDAIPGYISQPELETLKAIVKNVGCAIVGATQDIAPADRRIYAVRDITGTVESLDLITASILSKKLAAGLEGLVLDVKFGSGAFMEDYADAKELAQSLVSVSNNAGLPCTALLTNMDQVLGRTAGNSIEVRESIEFLRGENIDERLYEVVVSLASELLVIGKIASSTEEAESYVVKHLQDGRAAHFFERMVSDLGGPSDILDKFEKYLELAPQKVEIYPETSGVVSSVDAREIGMAIIELGGGRLQVEDRIDYGVGLASIAAPGEKVGIGDRPLCILFGRDSDKIDKARQTIQNAYTIAPPDRVIDSRETIKDRVTA
jgi:thymidine phosphorylase